jgi:hypothetical protein
LCLKKHIYIQKKQPMDKFLLTKYFPVILGQNINKFES